MNHIHIGANYVGYPTSHYKRHGLCQLKATYKNERCSVIAKHCMGNADGQQLSVCGNHRKTLAANGWIEEVLW